jgi:hypothetical protein
VGRKLLVASVLAAAAIVSLAFGSSQRTAIYSVGVAELLKGGMAGETVRVHGMLVSPEPGFKVG